MSTQQRTVPIGDFESFYRSRPDPYDMQQRWYERRKRALTIAALPRQTYSLALEPACGEGALTVLLAGRSGRLVATEGSSTALARARAALRDVTNVDLVHHVLPAAPPPGPYDLAVVAEVGYFLDEADLVRLRDAVLSTMTSGGDLVAVHWRHPSPDYPLDGPRVHTVLGEGSRLAQVVHHDDPDFVLDVWRTQ